MSVLISDRVRLPTIHCWFFPMFPLKFKIEIIGGEPTANILILCSLVYKE